jgi:hypothetical protein
MDDTRAAWAQLMTDDMAARVWGLWSEDDLRFEQIGEVLGLEYRHLLDESSWQRCSDMRMGLYAWQAAVRRLGMA